MNPVTTIDNLLDEYLPARYRRAVHVLVLLVSLAVTAYTASSGNWKAAVPAFLAAVYAAANKANTLVTPLDSAGYDDGSADGQTYEGMGGADFPPTHPEDGVDAVSGNAAAPVPLAAVVAPVVPVQPTGD